MAISILTDSERKVYNEVLASAGSSTRTKFKAVLKECGLIETPAQVIAMRKEIEKMRGEKDKAMTAAKRAAMQFFKGIGWIE
jgi:hypothetical protein